MSKNYSKTHSSETAAKKHADRIKKRGGKVTSEKSGSKVKLTYSFPKK